MRDARLVPKPLARGKKDEKGDDGADYVILPYAALVIP
jgi:hypothetical protein